MQLHTCKDTCSLILHCIIQQRCSLVTSATLSKNTHFYNASRSCLQSTSWGYLYRGAEEEIAALSSIRTQNWVTHTTSLSLLLLPSVLVPLLCYSFMSLQPGLPSFSRSCLLLFTPLCHCCSVSSAPFPSICSSFSPLLSGCVYLTLLLFRGFMPFTWEPLNPSLRALSSRCAYLTVMWAFVLRVEVNGPGGGARRPQSANRQLSSQMLLSVCSFPPSLRLPYCVGSIMTPLSVSSCEPVYPCKQR